MKISPYKYMNGEYIKEGDVVIGLNDWRDPIKGKVIRSTEPNYINTVAEWRIENGGCLHGLSEIKKVEEQSNSMNTKQQETPPIKSNIVTLNLSEIVRISSLMQDLSRCISKKSNLLDSLNAEYKQLEKQLLKHMEGIRE